MIKSINEKFYLNYDINKPIRPYFNKKDKERFKCRICGEKFFIAHRCTLCGQKTTYPELWDFEKNKFVRSKDTKKDYLISFKIYIYEEYRSIIKDFIYEILKTGSESIEKTFENFNGESTISYWTAIAQTGMSVESIDCNTGERGQSSFNIFKNLIIEGRHIRLTVNPCLREFIVDNNISIDDLMICI